MIPSLRCLNLWAIAYQQMLLLAFSYGGGADKLMLDVPKRIKKSKRYGNDEEKQPILCVN